MSEVQQQHTSPRLQIDTRYRNRLVSTDDFPKFVKSGWLRWITDATSIRREETIAFVAPMSEAIPRILPFLVILLFVLGIIICVPAVTLWFPGAIFGR